MHHKWLAGLFTLLAPSLAFSQCEPFYGQIVINEFMAVNNQTAADENGEFDDWVELHNPTDAAFNLEGYFLSDDHGTRTKFTFPDVDVEAGGYLIVWCDNQPNQGPLHASFGLSGDGEELGLYNTDTTSVDYVRFGASVADISIGRYPNGSGPQRRLIPTFNQENTNSVEPGLVINEYMASNEFTATDQWGEYADWIELYNNSNEPIDITGYYLTDKIGDPYQYEFPDTTMQAGEYLIVWCDMGLMEPGLHTFFGLGADGDDILLSRPDTTTVDYVRFGVQTTDESEGRYPNGTGPIGCPDPSFEASNGTPSAISAHAAPGGLKLWPNPATSSISIRYPATNSTALQFFNSRGKLVRQLNLKPGINQVPLAKLPPGIYLLRAGRKTSKLVVR